jgi:hypothetical protein
MFQKTIHGNPLLDYDVPAPFEHPLVVLGVHEQRTLGPVSGAVAVVIDNGSNP